MLACLPFLSLDLIPTYILARGEKAVEVYRRALKSGKTYDKRVKVLLIGEDRVGKTSLGKALKGEAFNEDEASTDGVLMSEALKNATEKPWRNSGVHRKSSAYKFQCAEFMRRRLTNQLSDENTTEEAIELTAVTQNTKQPGWFAYTLNYLLIYNQNSGKCKAIYLWEIFATT